MPEKLKACPHCGCTDIYLWKPENGHAWWIICKGCPAGTNSFPDQDDRVPGVFDCGTREDAIKRWNTRTPDPLVAAVVTAAEAWVETIEDFHLHGLPHLKAWDVLQEAVHNLKEAQG